MRTAPGRALPDLPAGQHRRARAASPGAARPAAVRGRARRGRGRRRVLEQSVCASARCPRRPAPRSPRARWRRASRASSRCPSATSPARSRATRSSPSAGGSRRATSASCRSRMPRRSTGAAGGSRAWRRPAGGRPEPFVVMAGMPSGLVWAPAGTGRSRRRARGRGLGPGLAHARRPHRRTGAVAGVVEAPLPRAPSSTAPIEVARARRADRRRAASRAIAMPPAAAASPPRGGPAQELTLSRPRRRGTRAASTASRSPPTDARRNVVTHGIDLNALVGRHFRIGAVHCHGQRLAEPCSWLQQLTPPARCAASSIAAACAPTSSAAASIALGDPVEPGVD